MVRNKKYDIGTTDFVRYRADGGFPMSSRYRKMRPFPISGRCRKTAIGPIGFLAVGIVSTKLNNFVTFVKM